MLAKIEKRLWIVALVLVALRLWLVHNIAIDTNSFATYDDFLFIRLAENILKGKWLGKYDCTTLMKGPFYPMFIAFVNRLGVSLSFAQQLLYCLACLLIIFALRPLIKRQSVLVILFIFLLFNPITYSYSSSLHVLREAIYPALTLMTTACLLGLVLRRPDESRFIWLWAVGFGFFYSAFMLTREEGIWLSTVIAILAGLALWLDWHASDGKLPDQRSPSQLAPALKTEIYPKLARFLQAIRATHLPAFAVAALAAAILPSIVFSLNYHYYGIFNKTEVDDHDFKAAYGALIRVKPEEYSPRTYLPAKTRQQVYQVSPAFAELEQAFNGVIKARWAIPTSVKGESEISGGAFIWAFRDAVASAGYYDQGVFPAEYYRRLAGEIRVACDNGKLACYPLQATLTPPLRSEHMVPFLSASRSAINMLIQMGGFKLKPYGSVGVMTDMDRFSALTRDRFSGQEREIVYKVTAFFTDGEKSSVPNLLIESSVIKLPIPITSYKNYSSQDLYKNLLKKGQDYPAAQNARFIIHTTYSDNPELLIYDQSKQIGDVPLMANMQPVTQQIGDLYVKVQSVEVKDLSPDQQRIDQIKGNLRGVIARIYKTSVPILSAAAIITYTWLTIQFFRRKTSFRLWVVLTVLLVGIFTRIALLALIDATSSYAISEVYLSPINPFLLTWIMISLFGFIEDRINFLMIENEGRNDRY